MNQVGLVGAVFGVNGALLFTGMAYDDNMLTGADYTDNFDKVDLKDGVGEKVGGTGYNRNDEATFTIVPVDSSGTPTRAAAAANVKLPDPMGIVTIKAKDGLAAYEVSHLAGDWNYVGPGKLGVTQEGYLSVTLPCSRKRNSDGTTTAFLPIG